MSNAENGDCLEIMLDMLCHEMIRGNLSPEMEMLFLAHLEACPACKERTSNFLDLLGLAAEPEVSRMVH